MRTILRRKLRHHKKARTAFRLLLIVIFLLAFFLIWPLILVSIEELIEYVPGQIFNPGRFAFNLAVTLLLFLFFWASTTLASGLKWLLLFLGIYDGQYVLNFFTYLVSRPSLLGIGDWITLPMYSIGLSLCFFTWIRNWNVHRTVRVVMGVSFFSIAVTAALYVSYYGATVGIVRALIDSLPGPFVAFSGIILRTRGDWESRETKESWLHSKEIQTEDWTRPDEEVIKADIDSFNKSSREAVVHICRYSTGGKCDNRVLRVSDSLGGLVWDEIEEFSGKDAYLSIKNGQVNAISFWGIPKKDDALIYEVIRKSCAELDVKDVGSNFLFWKHGKIPVIFWPYSHGSPRWLQIDERLSGKIEPSELEPLIMSTLIMHQKTKKRKILDQIEFVLGISAIFLIWFPPLTYIVSRGFLGPTVGSIMVLGGFGCAASLVATIKWVKGLRLEADRATCRRLGESKCLGIFEKVQKVAPTVKGPMIQLVHIFESEPSIEERTRSLAKRFRVTVS